MNNLSNQDFHYRSEKTGYNKYMGVKCGAPF